MNITNVKINFIQSENNKLLAIASILIDDEIVVNGLKIIQGQDSLFVAMPSIKDNNGEYFDIAHPINTTTRDVIQSIVLDEYNKIKNNNLEV